MKSTATIVLIAALSVSLAGCSDNSWTLVHTQGVLHFVHINDDGQRDNQQFRSVAEEICRGKRICQVLFWNDKDLVPTRTPMSRAQERAKVAHWSYNANTGLRQLAWSCSIKQESNCF